jgi:diaminopimelate decarboxylase
MSRGADQGPTAVEPETAAGDGSVGPRARCHGVVRLTGRLEPWADALCRDPALLAGWIDRHGSPVNVLEASPMARNAAELRRAATEAGVELGIFFARKANKALAFVDEALRLGLGVDVASERELGQALERGVPPARIVVTAAVKPAGLLELCAARGPTVVVDNEDELIALSAIAGRTGRTLPVALRLAPEPAAGRPETRFGLPAGELVRLVERHWTAGGEARLAVAGVHFHLDGYDPAERVAGLGESFAVVDSLRARGHTPGFVDFGGGIPISYLDDAGEWRRFWEEHRSAVRGEREPLTFEGHGLGLSAPAGVVLGRPNVYPYHQQPTRGAWLGRILGASVKPSVGPGTVADAARARGLELRCEPGRSLLDGCGLSAARVEFRKQRRDGSWLIGVAMNRTQCRSTADDFLVDPLLLQPGRGAAAVPVPGSGPIDEPIEGYLVGAYCIERELLTWRRLCFPRGVAVGDIVVFPNTAGYLMHILESASHQIPLARNLVLGGPGGPVLDAIEQAGG